VGDIIYLKFNLDIQDKVQLDGIIMGNGISSNKLAMLAFDYKYSQNGFNQFRKCLFRIENKKQYAMAEK